MKKEITTTIVDRKALVSSPKGTVMGIIQDTYLVVDELYISTVRKSWGYNISLGTCGNSMTYKLDTPQEVAEVVAANYDDYIGNCKQLAIPMSQSYIDRWGTGME